MSHSFHSQDVLPEQLLCTRGCSEDSEYTSAQTLPAPGTPVLATLPCGLSDCIGGAAREPVLPTTELLREGITSNQVRTLRGYTEGHVCLFTTDPSASSRGLGRLPANSAPCWPLLEGVTPSPSSLQGHFKFLLTWSPHQHQHSSPPWGLSQTPWKIWLWRERGWVGAGVVVDICIGSWCLAYRCSPLISIIQLHTAAKIADGQARWLRASSFINSNRPSCSARHPHHPQ